MMSLLGKTGMWFGPLMQNLEVTMRKWKWLFVMAVLGQLDPGGESLCRYDPSKVHELHTHQHRHISDGVNV
jgi:hypothetical protein